MPQVVQACGKMWVDALLIWSAIVPRFSIATWLMEKGTDHRQAAGWLGMTVEQLEQTCGHRHPDFQSEVAIALPMVGAAGFEPATPASRT